MPESDAPTALGRYGGFLVFFTMTVGSLAWATWSIFDIYNQISSASEVIYFDKGALYMFGVGVGLAVLSFAIFYEGILERELTKKISGIMTKSAIAGIALMFLLPYLIHQPVNKQLTQKKYIICEPASYQWLLYENLAYTKNASICDSLPR